MSSNIFDISKFEGLSLKEVQDLASEIRKNFEDKNGYYRSYNRNSYLRPKYWNEYNEIYKAFKSKYNELSSEWSARIILSQDRESYIKFLEKMSIEFDKMDVCIERFRPSVNEHSESVENLKEEVLENIKGDLEGLAKDFKAQLEEGIKSLNILKNEIGLSKEFSDSIIERKKVVKDAKMGYFIAFIASILLIPVFIISSFYLDKLTEQLPLIQWSVRVSIVAAMGLMSNFFFNQYKIHQLFYLKVDHLCNFLNGGATFISELIGLEGENRKDVNKKMANLFIEIDDLLNIYKRNKHPTEKVTDKALDTVNKAVNIISKNNNG